MFGSQSPRAGLRPWALALAAAPALAAARPWALALATAPALAAAGCGQGPGAALIPTPSRQATVLPSEVPPVRPDGYANILADPATVPGLPRRAERNEADEAALAARGRATEAAAANLDRPRFGDELSRRATTHVEKTRAAIEADARPRTDAPPRLSDVAPNAVPRQPTEAAGALHPGRPLDPEEPSPRTVGGPPFEDGEVAPPDQ